jgi:hypothetical protein
VDVQGRKLDASDEGEIIPKALAHRLARFAGATTAEVVRMNGHDEPVEPIEALDGPPIEEPAAQAPGLVLQISPDGTWVDIQLEDRGRTYVGRSDSTPHGIVEGLVTVLAAREGTPTPKVLDVSANRVGRTKVLTVVVQRSDGSVGAGSAPLEGSMTAAIQGAVAQAMEASQGTRPMRHAST